jgi:hypothetical protein
MALKLNQKNKRIKYILSIDDSLDVSEEEFQEYQKRLDESLLKFKKGKNPTRLILNSVLDFESKKQLASERYVFDAGSKQGRVNLGSSYEEVRRALVGIENPEDIPADQKIHFMKEIDGYASKDLVASLGDEIVLELWGVLRKVEPEEEKKTEELKKG